MRLFFIGLVFIWIMAYVGVRVLLVIPVRRILRTFSGKRPTETYLAEVRASLSEDDRMGLRLCGIVLAVVISLSMISFVDWTATNLPGLKEEYPVYWVILWFLEFLPIAVLNSFNRVQTVMAGGLLWFIYGLIVLPEIRFLPNPPNATGIIGAFMGLACATFVAYLIERNTSRRASMEKPIDGSPPMPD